MISKPQPGPAGAPIPDPIYYVAPPRMAPPAPSTMPLTHRLSDADFKEVEPWLVPLLIEGRPAADPEAVFAWLRALANDRAVFLMRTPDVVGLAEIRRTTLVPAGIVSEVFVRSRVQNNIEAIALYRAMRDWGMEAGAEELRLFVDSDAAMTHVIPALFDLSRDFAPKKRTLYVAEIRKR